MHLYYLVLLWFTFCAPRAASRIMQKMQARSLKTTTALTTLMNCGGDTSPFPEDGNVVEAIKFHVILPIRTWRETLSYINEGGWTAAVESPGSWHTWCISTQQATFPTKNYCISFVIYGLVAVPYLAFPPSLVLCHLYMVVLCNVHSPSSGLFSEIGVGYITLEMAQAHWIIDPAGECKITPYSIKTE